MTEEESRAEKKKIKKLFSAVAQSGDTDYNNNI
jgi:hypothetical protein